MTEKQVEGFHEAIQQMGRILFEYVASAMGTSQWSRAWFHVLNNFSMVRVAMPDGSINADLGPPSKGGFFTYLNEVRATKDRFAKKWHGFKLFVFPTGECTVEFDYNESDPKFFDS